MKIKLLNKLLIIDILTILLILAILVIPSNPLLIIPGLPFLLFFPGFVLVSALFARKEGMEWIEKIALSFGMSIAVTTLIGLGLHYTSWGIRLEPVLFSISSFIIIFSVVALFRQLQFGVLKITTEYHLKLPSWEGSPFDKTLSVILAVAILGTVSVFIYMFAFTKVGQRFTEFYILGINGMAADYPTNFVLNSNLDVVGVQYGTNTPTLAEKWGQLTLVIVNHEQQNTSYTVVMQIDGSPVGIPFQGGIVQSMGPIVLAPEAKWEQGIGIVPQHTGDDQEMELFLYKDDGTDAYLTLHLWIDVTQ